MFGSVGKPIPQGIAQGGLGDCWFLASLAAVADFTPKAISYLITNAG